MRKKGVGVERDMVEIECLKHKNSRDWFRVYFRRLRRKMEGWGVEGVSGGEGRRRVEIGRARMLEA